MKYKEVFLMNHVYVAHPHRRVPVKLCPRDEVAHPSKLIDVVRANQRTWREININAGTLYHMRFEYDKRFYRDLVSSHFYVLTDSESICMFTDAARVSWDDEQDMFEFLERHGSTMFAITSPVFRLETSLHRNDIYYSIPVHVNNDPVYLAPDNVVELRDMINSRCYTVCNGFTLFLAMVRGRGWSGKVAWYALQRWTEVQPDIQQGSVWHNLHVSHPVPMIGDFPAYYATMNPPLPFRFMCLLDREDALPSSQFVEQINENSAMCLYSTPITSMFPYFHKSIFHYYNPRFHVSDDTLPLFETPFGTDENDEQLVDIEGFFIAMLRSKRAWKWWKQNGALYMRHAYQINGNSIGFLMYCFQVLFYLYKRPYYDISYSHSRVRSIWVLLIELFDVSPQDMKLFLQINIVRSTIYKHFNIRRWHPSFPISFLVDVFNIYKSRIDWFDTHTSRVYTTNTYDPRIMGAIFAPYLMLQNEQTNEYLLKCSIYQLLKFSRTGLQFIESILDKRITNKIHCIQELFGLKNNPPVLDFPEQGAYEVGNVLMDYLRTHRDCFI